MPILYFLTVALAVLLPCKAPAAGLDLFATHTVTVQFSTQDGKPMADAEVKVYAPGDPTHVYKIGRTDKNGKFDFGTDRDGMWTAEARTGGEVARATLRVGGTGDDQSSGMSPYLLIGGLGVLLLMAVGYHVLRARSRTPRG